MTNLERRLNKLEGLLTDVSGLVPHTEKWLEYWKRWFECSIRDSYSRRGEKIPLEAARAIMQTGFSDEEGLEDDD
jgi:hypothetical protein